MSYESPELSEIDPSFYDADHTYTGTKIISTGIAVNTDVISNIPESLADLTKAEYKDELIMPSPLYSGAAAYNLGVITRTDGLGWEFYQGLKDNGVKVDKGNGAVQKAVVAGENGLGLLVDYMAIRSKNDGAPIEFVYPSEGSLCVTEPDRYRCRNKERGCSGVLRRLYPLRGRPESDSRDRLHPDQKRSCGSGGLKERR